MAHYAFITDGIVTEVITGIDETETIEGLDTETWYGNFRGQACKRTSYNGNIRKNYAGIGFTYDATRDAFITPKPFNSWVLDENNIVTEVITGIDETELIEGLDTETWYGNFRGQTCKRTSYNGNIRKNYAGIGYTYDSDRNAFIPPKPFDLWLLNEDTCRWEPPIPYPTDGEIYVWNEADQSWDIDA